MAYVGNPGSNKIITTDAGGKLTPGTVGSGVSLTAGTLTTATTVAFDCDFTLMSNQSITGTTVITDQESRSLTFTPSFAGTASMAIVNGSGLGLTTASNGARARLFSTFSGFGRLPFFGKPYRIWLRWLIIRPLEHNSCCTSDCTMNHQPPPERSWLEPGESTQAESAVPLVGTQLTSLVAT